MVRINILEAARKTTIALLGRPDHWSVEVFVRVFSEIIHFPLAEASAIIHEVCGSRSSPIVFEVWMTWA